MALIECGECGKQISDKAVSCPGCGAPVSTGITTDNNVVQPKIATEAKHKQGSSPITFGIVALVAIFILARCVSGGDDKTGGGAATRDFDWNDALTMCKMTIKKASKDPEKADVPYVANHGSGDEFRYVWSSSTKLTRMRNGLGLEVGVPASCTVSRSQKRITSLIVDGQKVL